ncbi:Golgi resident protein GCP60-like [Paramormyrops kingsleyae]|uniref:Golgi resident protein GCP60-like n=1 Tax=Paramormyrops kingsleyae TaxID=1676925 RepID=UPI003B978055
MFLYARIIGALSDFPASAPAGSSGASWSEVGTWPPRLTLVRMAMEVRAPERSAGGSGRLEVSIDGLTLSPDAEVEPDDGGSSKTDLPDSGGQVHSHFGEKDGEVDETARTVERKWGFTLQELYNLALQFFKEKDGKAFHPAYEEKLHLVALHKQVLLGPFNPDICPEVGFFDVLGNDRRKEWAALGNMTKEDAMVEFVKLLNKCCNLFAPYVTSHKIEKEEQERKRQEEEERKRLEEEEQERRRLQEERLRREQEERLRREQEERRQADEERLRMEQQKQQIMAALNAQTVVQFQQYAAQQYPGNPEQQQVLIRQLQEQHYQQYMQQLYQVQLAQQQAALQKQQEATAASAVTDGRLSGPSLSPGDLTVNGQAGTPTESPDRDAELEAAEDLLENGPQVTSPAPVITAPSMWTRPQIKDFKEKIRQDVDSVITVGRGEVVTVRVPTHEEGSYLFWEFATDYYDIGFGVYFEWTDSSNAAVSVHVSESSDEDDEGEGQNEEQKAQKNTSKPQVDEIVPVYRRDCHEEVYAGSHQYPGRGIYLLKFDNSYSLWRSKSVYYRVYYTR